jgi:hypothetical protein
MAEVNRDRPLKATKRSFLAGASARQRGSYVNLLCAGRSEACDFYGVSTYQRSRHCLSLGMKTNYPRMKKTTPLYDVYQEDALMRFMVWTLIVSTIVMVVSFTLLVLGTTSAKPQQDPIPQGMPSHGQPS